MALQHSLAAQPCRHFPVLQGCAARLCCKAVLQGCAARLCCKAVLQGCAARLCCKAVLQSCAAGLCCKAVLQGCAPGLCCKAVLQSLLQACAARLCCKAVLQSLLQGYRVLYMTALLCVYIHCLFACIAVYDISKHTMAVHETDEYDLKFVRYLLSSHVLNICSLTSISGKVKGRFTHIR